MVEAGRWRATRPDVVGHAGFRLNALVSLLANASWGKLAAEFVRVKDDSDELQTFVNTILAQGWKDAAVEVDEAALAERVEPFGLDAIPPEVLLVTVDVDVQDDRLEDTVCGWSRTDAMLLAHVVLWGSPDDDSTWLDRDELLRTRWKHPHGGTLRVDAAVGDSGDRTDQGSIRSASRGSAAGCWRAKASPARGLHCRRAHRKCEAAACFSWGSTRWSRRYSSASSAAARSGSATPSRPPTSRSSPRSARWCATSAGSPARAGLQISLDAREGELATPTLPPMPTTSVPSPFVTQW
jgi:hypothetical protein